MLPDRLPQEPFGLVKELESEMWPQLHWTQAQSKAHRACVYVWSRGSLRKAKISDAKLRGPQIRRHVGGDELVTCEENAPGLIDGDPILRESLQQFRLGQTADLDSPGDHETGRIGCSTVSSSHLSFTVYPEPVQIVSVANPRVKPEREAIDRAKDKAELERQRGVA